MVASGAVSSAPTVSLPAYAEIVEMKTYCFAFGASSSADA